MRRAGKEDFLRVGKKKFKRAVRLDFHENIYLRHFLKPLDSKRLPSQMFPEKEIQNKEAEQNIPIFYVTSPMFVGRQKGTLKENDVVTSIILRSTLE